jgi:integrase
MRRVIDVLPGDGRIAPTTPADTELGAVAAASSDAAREYQRGNKAPSTRRAYRGDWKRFVEWCDLVLDEPMPAAPVVVANYLAHLAKSGKKVPTIHKALAAITFAHRLADQPFDRRNKIIQETLGGIERDIGTAPKKKAALEDGGLRLVLAGISTTTMRALRDRSLLLVGWFSSCRRSEIAALNLADVAFTDEGIRLTIRKSKTDQIAAGREVGIPYAGDHTLCPVRALKAYLEATGIESGPLFRDIRAGTIRGGICAETVANIVKRACRRAGIDEKDYGGHSLRSGFVTTAFRRGKSLASVARQTGHKSMTVLLGYERHATLFVDNAAAGLL